VISHGIVSGPSQVKSHSIPFRFVLPNSVIHRNLRRLTIPTTQPYDALWFRTRLGQGISRMRRCARMLRQSAVFGAPAWLLVVIWLPTVGCVRRQTPPPLRIAAASDLQLVLPRLTDQFQARTGIVASITFGASGQLAEQIKQGAPFDVFLSANETFVRDLAGGGFIKPGSMHRYARGSLVLAVYPDVGDKVKSLADLTRPEVKKIALANPSTAPYGKAGKQALVNAGLWDQLQPKIVIAESVRQALLYVQKGDAEAALVGRAIANVPDVRSVEVDAQLYDPIIQALGVTAATARSADAEQFALFVIDAEGQRTLKEFGFTSAEAEHPEWIMRANERQIERD
jgi:molybdate transport system substrate-binding protein